MASRVNHVHGAPFNPAGYLSTPLLPRGRSCSPTLASLGAVPLPYCYTPSPPLLLTCTGPLFSGPFTRSISIRKRQAWQVPYSQKMYRTEKQVGVDLPSHAGSQEMYRTEKQVEVDLSSHADNSLPQLERGLSHNKNPNPQLFVVQDDRPPPGNGDGSESDSGGARTLLGDETYPEGGRTAWLVVFGCWCK